VNLVTDPAEILRGMTAVSVSRERARFPVRSLLLKGQFTPKITILYLPYRGHKYVRDDYDVNVFSYTLFR